MMRGSSARQGDRRPGALMRLDQPIASRVPFFVHLAPLRIGSPRRIRSMSDHGFSQLLIAPGIIVSPYVDDGRTIVTGNPLA
jgi:hypothetical protein